MHIIKPIEVNGFNIQSGYWKITAIHWTFQTPNALSLTLSGYASEQAYSDGQSAILAETVILSSNPLLQLEPEMYQAIQAEEPQNILPPPEPNWLDFRLAIFQDAAYQQVRLATAPAALSAFETEIRATDTYLPMLPVLWSGILALTPEESRPTAEDYEQWNAVATASNIPTSWTPNGVLEVL